LLHCLQHFKAQLAASLHCSLPGMSLQSIDFLATILVVPVSEVMPSNVGRAWHSLEGCIYSGEYTSVHVYGPKKGTERCDTRFKIPAEGLYDIDNGNHDLAPSTLSLGSRRSTINFDYIESRWDAIACQASYYRLYLSHAAFQIEQQIGWDGKVITCSIMGSQWNT